MLNRSDAIELINDQLLPIYRKERERLDRLDLWYRWRGEDLPIPRGATRELKRLIELSRDPWLRLVVAATAQAMYVDGYRSPERQSRTGWRAWQANDMDNRQVPIHRAALAYGQSFATVLPGELNGEHRAVIRGVSPRKMITAYADDVEDDWPMFALRVEKSGSSWALRLYDEQAVYYASTTALDGGKTTYIESRTHDIGVCPVVRYANLDLDGRTDGEVEPFISVAARINKTSYDRLLTQHFASWKVRTVAGMAQPDTQEESNRKKLQLRQDDILVADDPDTKFGTLDETPLDGFIRGKQADIGDLAAVSQTPATALNGSNIANLSADAIAELRAGHTQKVFEWQKSLGKSHEQGLRLSAHIEGDEDAAGDVMAHVTWADMQIRSLSQAVDALGKAAQMLGIPPQALWSRIPGVSKTDVDEWEQMLRGNDAMAQLTKMLEEQISGGNTGPAQ